jgi:hypothetical protein
MAEAEAVDGASVKLEPAAEAMGEQAEGGGDANGVAAYSSADGGEEDSDPTEEGVPPEVPVPAPETFDSEWTRGDVVDVDTEGGVEVAVIMGRAQSGEPTELHVCFADGVEDDWDVLDFRPKWTVGEVVDVVTEDGSESGAIILGGSEAGDPREVHVRFSDGVRDDWPWVDFRKRPTAAGGPEGGARAAGHRLPGSEHDLTITLPPAPAAAAIAPTRSVKAHSSSLAADEDVRTAQWTERGHPINPSSSQQEPSGLDEWLRASAPFPSWNRSILTEIYLCHACSYHEI